MIAIPHKTKQFLLVLVKVLIVAMAFFYIYNRLQSDKSIDFSVITHYISPVSILILLIFSSANWFFEVLKWQNLVRAFKNISFYKAMQQTLGSLTASIFTPNRIGEYGAKMLYFKKENAKQIVLLNFVHNSSQMFITTVFGILGLFMSFFERTETMFWVGFKVSGIKLVGFVLVLVFLAFVFLKLKNIEIYGFSIQKLILKIKQLKREILFKTVLFSGFRYLIFSSQFYFLLLIFDINIDFFQAFSTIFLFYFLSSIVPSIHFLDIVVKSSVAVFLFSKFGIPDYKILTITSLMWIFNLVLPVILGSFFVFQFRLNRN